MAKFTHINLVDLAFGAPNTESKDAEMLPDWWTG